MVSYINRASACSLRLRIAARAPLLQTSGAVAPSVGCPSVFPEKNVRGADFGASISRAGVVVLLLALLAGVPRANAATLTARVDKTEVVLGGAVVLEVTSVVPGDARPLDGLPLDPLAADFEVLDVSRGTRSVAGQTTQTLTASLYPRRAGRARIPGLRASNARSAPIDITVLESGPDRDRVLFRAGIEPNAPYVRAGSVLYLDIYDSNDFSWAAPVPLPSAGVHLRTLAQSTRAETIDGKRYTVQRYAWAATVLRDGTIDIAFEALRARKFGLRLLYSIPKFGFTAQPVPAWLPVYVPVGAPELHVDPVPPEWVVGRPVNWQFTVTGSGLSANGLAQLLAATLDVGDGVQLYAPLIEPVEEPRARTPLQTFRVTVPVQALRHGAAELPRLALPYFDSRRARLETVIVPGARIAAISPARQTASRVATVMVALLLVAAFARYVSAGWRRMRQRREMFARIHRAQNARDIKSAVLDWAVARDMPRATLRRWARRASADSKLQQWTTQLERACYAARAGDIAALKNSARRVLRVIPATARSPNSRSPSR